MQTLFCRSVRLHAARAALEPLTRPHSEHDVDGELWLLLDIASDDELVEVYDILFGAPRSIYLEHTACLLLHAATPATLDGMCGTGPSIPASTCTPSCQLRCLVWHTPHRSGRRLHATPYLLRP